uniref:Uncharacterized protein n=1 Tax=Romanomermis culicivorax TaxID=13658 RepID=A0A915HMD7_ROMCU
MSFTDPDPDLGFLTQNLHKYKEAHTKAWRQALGIIFNEEYFNERFYLKIALHVTAPELTPEERCDLQLKTCEPSISTSISTQNAQYKLLFIVKENPTVRTLYENMDSPYFKKGEKLYLPEISWAQHDYDILIEECCRMEAKGKKSTPSNQSGRLNLVSLTAITADESFTDSKKYREKYNIVEESREQNGTDRQQLVISSQKIHFRSERKRCVDFIPFRSTKKKYK